MTKRKDAWRSMKCSAVEDIPATSMITMLCITGFRAMGSKVEGHCWKPAAHNLHQDFFVSINTSACSRWAMVSNAAS